MYEVSFRGAYDVQCILDTYMESEILQNQLLYLQLHSVPVQVTRSTATIYMHILYCRQLCDFRNLEK